MASFIAAIVDAGLALLKYGEISKAVPCKGEVRTNGKPKVKFTPVSKEVNFKGIKA